MKLAAAILAAACTLLLIPFAAGAEAPELSFHWPDGASPRFQHSFITEYEGMVKSWWRHGGQGASRGRWHVTGREVVRSGFREPDFVVSVAVERDGMSLLVLATIEISPLGQRWPFLASHAAYSITLGAILGDTRGSHRWDGGGERETARNPTSIRSTGVVLGTAPFPFQPIMLPSLA